MDALARLLRWHSAITSSSPRSLGTVVGLFFGSIPGLTFSMALALMLPFTFGMRATPASRCCSASMSAA